MRVRDVMTTDVTTVAPDTDLREVAVGSNEHARAIGVFVDRVPGVVSVASRLHREGRQ
jgi:CBS domain-containing protein